MVFAVDNAPRTSQAGKPLTAFISFPSPYTQTLLLQALVSTLPSLSISLVPPEDNDPPALQWADYDLMSFDVPHASPTTHLISSYIYRKALIRKHQLHLTITEYLAKSSHRGRKSILDRQGGGWMQGWNVEIQFADELDEMWVDELYELGEALNANESLPEGEKKWFILKPGFADRAQGIRIFSTQEELQDIFEEFEPGSSDDESDAGPSNQVEAYREFKREADKALEMMRANGLKIEDSDSEDGQPESDGRGGGHGAESDDASDGEDGTGVMTSQLRHFVIQEYLNKPVLFDIAQTPNDPESALSGYKFHLRAYVLLTGAYQVHVSRTMLALFSGSSYASPTSSDDLDLRPHLTNTCLQTDAFGVPSPPEELVKLFSELEGLNALSHWADDSGKVEYTSRGAVSKAWLDKTFAKVGEVVAESIRAGVECGSFGLQLMPNAFEIFGVDLMLSFPESAVETVGELAVPRVTLLEYNASPDFHQSGNRLRRDLGEMFRGVVELSVKPFFGLERQDDAGEGGYEGMQVGDEKYGWALVGQGEVRGPTA